MYLSRAAAMTLAVLVVVVIMIILYCEKVINWYAVTAAVGIGLMLTAISYDADGPVKGAYDAEKEDDFEAVLADRLQEGVLVIRLHTTEEQKVELEKDELMARVVMTDEGINYYPPAELADPEGAHYRLNKVSGHSAEDAKERREAVYHIIKALDNMPNATSEDLAAWLRGASEHELVE
jgi:hypothetical protein